MNVITYDVYKNTVKKHDGFNPVTSEKNYSKLQFRFRDDDDWSNCTVVTASFWLSNNIVKSDVELLSDNLTATFDIPPEFSGVKGTLKIGLQGTYKKDNEDVTIATNIITLNRNDGVIVTEGTNSVLYEKIIALVNKYFNEDKEIIDAFVLEVNEALSGKLDNTASSVTTDNIANKAVTSDKIANGAITSTKLANSAVSGSNIAQNQIVTNHLQNRAITTEKLADDVQESINSKANKATTLGGYGITDGENVSNKVSAFDFQHLNATDYPNITALYNYHTNYVEPCYDEIDNLENNKADKATVDTALAEKLDNTAGSVTTDNIANKAVTTDKIANGAVDALKIAPDAIRSTHIASEQIDTVHIVTGAVTTDKLADEVKTSINGKADKATTLAGYGINDGENIGNKASTESDVTSKTKSYPSIAYLLRYYYNFEETDALLAPKTDQQELVNTLPQFLEMPVKVTARALCVDGTNLYHSGTASYTVGGVKHMYATSKVDVSTEINPTFIGKLGGRDKCYPRNMAIGNGYLYVPYRDSKSGELSSFDTDTDIGGYLDIIRLSDFTLEENSIAYSREPYKITTVVDGVEKEVTRYFGKSNFVATHNDSLLCVTQQMGGWKLYDISTTPENPTLLYSYDNRADIYIDNADKGGYADFQQPAFFEDTNGNIYLAISGYDRDLLMIYDLSDPSNPQEVFGFHCGENQLNLRTVPEGGILTTPYIHALGLACAYPYIYCTIAPHPNYLNDTENAFEGIAVVDVSDIENIKTSIFKMPDEDRALYNTGEPSPTSIAVNSKHLIMDNADKGISVWSLKNSAEPKYLGCLNTGTPVCSVCMTEDGRTFAGAAVGEKYVDLSGSMTMYRGL